MRLRIRTWRVEFVTGKVLVWAHSPSSVNSCWRLIIERDVHRSHQSSIQTSELLTTIKVTRNAKNGSEKTEDREDFS
ncbi:uncharacterized protein ARMOST_20273 [Armillaria ostoyae]|uniref:Uncharacterized protein n=1 Tax=Armillaria ostoyae TaxID=47428 RepID=A0A284S6X5_ARMOS|nr:uncharacterized protein ARMOST_20273 [Armillaria ostoyae]